MFIREVHTKAPKTGKVYTAHRLVASRKTDKGPRQHVVMMLADFTLPREKWAELAQLLECKLAGQEMMFAVHDPEVARAADAAMKNYRFVQTRQKEFDDRKNNADLKNIDINSLGHTLRRSLGPELVALSFWNRLEFDKHLRVCGLSMREASLAKAVILGRLIHPGSELDFWNWMRKQSSLPELIDDDLEDIGKNPVYRIADILLQHKDALEKNLYLKQRELLGKASTVFLYDLTNTYFEGRCANNPLALHGVSKEKRSDCRLVTLALVVDGDAIPVFSKVYEGSQSEPETLEDILQEVAPKDNPAFAVRPTIIMDRGIATKENLQKIRDRNLPYAVIERRDQTQDFVDEFHHAKENFETMEGASSQRVLIKKIVPDESGPALLLCLSEARREKERAINSLHQNRFDEELAKIRATVAKKKTPVDKIERRIGRLTAKFSSIAKHFSLRAILEKDGSVKEVVCKELDSGKTRNDTHGCYVIETSHRDMPAVDIWHLYMTLTRVEGAFRALKSDLGFRPVFHQLELRTKGHLFISVLAYHLLATIESQMKTRGLTQRWSTLREELANYSRATMVYCDSDDQIWHRRTSAIPEPHHKEIFDLLEIKDPLIPKTAIVGKRSR